LKDGKGITDVKYWVQNLLGTESTDKKVFIDTFISEDHCIRDALSSGLIIRHYSFQDINSESIANIDINSTIEVPAVLFCPIFVFSFFCCNCN